MEIKWGIIPDMSGSVTLRNLMGIDTAMELAMSGREGGGGAKSLGLVSRVCTDPWRRRGHSPGPSSPSRRMRWRGIKQLYTQAWARSDEAMLQEETRLQRQILGRPTSGGPPSTACCAGACRSAPRRNAL